jgi:hypothetical protein
MGILRAGQDTAGELPLGSDDAAPVGLGGWAADVFSGGELAVVLSQGVEAGPPVLVSVLIGEPGVVGSGVAERDLDVQMAVLDRAGDEPARPADDVPGQRAPEASRRDGP